ncbi:MAG: DNA double-strand break repair nuclease NurA [Leptolyngbyaceae cyanobacterium CSU_1_4]|nr:DNA double-strand break repair nuclease NurA [Leptolyngbyaceae cyanobacterium CSU_1_4]
MLDLMKLARQMQGIGQHLNQEAAATRQRLDLAQQLLEQAKEHQADLVAQQQIWRDRLGFTAAEPVEPLDTRVDLIAAPLSHTVIATDGSQIAPSHHEIAYCYLINVGRVIFHYGQNRHPLLDSLPEIFYRPEDLYVSRQWGIRTEEWMGYQRTVSEAVVLAEMGTELAKDVLRNPPPLSPSPTLAMVDGSLIHWFLESLPADARDRLLPPVLQAWDQLRAARIPFVSYISAARSSEALNFLRLHTCPFMAPDCSTHCPGKTDQAPCQVFSPLRDTALWSMVLAPGQRSLIWKSAAKILEAYGDHTVYFCYIHMGSEVARVEFPAWVAEDPTLLNSALSLTLTQVQKGYGYPVALAEAHNQAVVRGGDRARFFSLLEQQMIRAGLKNIGTSYKESRKRNSIA